MHDLLEAASICRSLALSDLDGAGALLLFALYFENVASLREGATVDPEKYELGIGQLLDPMSECLNAIESFDPVKLNASLDSFARTALRLGLP